MGCRNYAKKQITIDSCLVITDNKPDIEKIIRVTSRPILTKVVVIDRKIIICGHVDITIEYAACAPCNTQPVHFAAFKVPFANFVDHCGARSGQDAKISIDIEFQQFHTSNRRTIIMFLILNMCAFKLEAARFRTEMAICPTEHISCGSDEPIPCPPPPVCDCSHVQPCSCVSCNC